jgi:hypothetical protein
VTVGGFTIAVTPNRLSSVEINHSEADDERARLVRSSCEYRLRRGPYRYRFDRRRGLVRRYGAGCGSFQNLIFECHPFGIIFL